MEYLSTGFWLAFVILLIRALLHFTGGILVINKKIGGNTIIFMAHFIIDMFIAALLWYAIKTLL